jgi:hypothetical protein
MLTIIRDIPERELSYTDEAPPGPTLPKTRLAPSLQLRLNRSRTLSPTVQPLGPDANGVSFVANLPIDFHCIKTLPNEFSKPHA